MHEFSRRHLFPRPFLAPLALLPLLVAALLWLAAADTAIAQSGDAPTITAGPVIVSSPASGDTYGKGETIQVALTFSEPVTVTTSAKGPRVHLDVGGRTRWARYQSSDSGGARLVFAYTAKGGDADPDGVSVPKNGLKMMGASIADSDGNAAKRKHPALSNQSAHKVNGSPPQPEPTVIPAPTPTPTPEPVQAQPPQPQPQVTDNTPPTIQSLGFNWKAPGSSVIIHIGHPRTKTVGAASQIRANITFSEAIDESQTTIKYRIGSGSERTFSFASSEGEGKCYYVSGAGLYDCTYTPTAGESGLFQVRVTAYKDTSGNAGVPSSYHTGWGITVDPRAPKAPTLALKNPASSPSNVARPEFTATLSETGGILWVWPNEQFICDDFYGRREGYGHLFKREDVTDATQPYMADIVPSRAAAITSDGAVTFYAIHTDEHFNPSPCGTFTYVYDSTPPAKPRDLVAKRGSASGGFDTLTLTWDDPKDPSIAKYQFRQRLWDGIYPSSHPTGRPKDNYPSEWTDIPVGDAAVTSHAITGRDRLEGYFVQLRAVDRAGNVGAVAEVDVTPDSGYQPPLTWENQGKLFWSGHYRHPEANCASFLRPHIIVASERTFYQYENGALDKGTVISGVGAIDSIAQAKKVTSLGAFVGEYKSRQYKHTGKYTLSRELLSYSKCHSQFKRYGGLLNYELHPAGATPAPRDGMHAKPYPPAYVRHQPYPKLCWGKGGWYEACDDNGKPLPGAVPYQPPPADEGPRAKWYPQWEWIDRHGQ